MADEIVLTIPREPGFQRVAHLVLGGLVARLDLTFENLADLQIALDSLLDREDGVATDDIVVRMTPGDHELLTVVGPFSARLLRELDGAGDAEDELGLRRVLDSTVDDVRVDGDFVQLTKRVDRG